MARGRLVIGNKRYSSWSLRGWLAVKLAGLDVEEIVVPMAGGNTPALKGGATPAGMVPYLEHDGAHIWESLAICEYCAECAPSLWPKDRLARAQARSIAAEMHAGFGPLRQAMSMNLGRPAGPLAATPYDVTADIDRIQAIWAQTRDSFGGGRFLFGDELTASDVMFAPVVARFLTYRPPLNAASQAYCAAMRAHKLMAQWYDEAAAEPDSWLIAKYEAMG